MASRFNSTIEINSDANASKSCIQLNSQYDKVVLGVLFLILALRMATHALLPDGSSQSIARFDLEKGNAEYIVYFFWVYGLTQIGLLMHHGYAMLSKNTGLVREAIIIQTVLSLNHIIMINFLWDSVKDYPFPLDKSNNRPGAWLWYAELMISGGYLIFDFVYRSIKPSKIN